MSDATNAAALSAGGQVAATGINAMSTESANRKNRQWNEKMYDRQKQDSIDMWNMQNQYNSPQEQMRRLKEAGLNPNLVYGTGTVANNASTPQTPKAAQSDWKSIQVDTNMVGDTINTYYNVQRQKQELDNLKTQQEVMQSQKFYTDVKAITEGFRPSNIQADTDLKQQKFSNTNSSFPVTLEKMFADLALTKANAMLAETKNTFTKDENVRQEQMQAQNIQEKIANIALIKQNTVKSAADTERIKEATKVLNSQGYLNYLEGQLRTKFGMSYNDDLQWRMAAKVYEAAENVILGNGFGSKSKEQKIQYYEKIEKYEKLGPKY